MKTVEITYRYGSSRQCPRRAVSPRGREPSICQLGGKPDIRKRDEPSDYRG
jgi:hypothetical protein